MPQNAKYEALVGSSLDSCRESHGVLVQPVEAVVPWVDPIDPVNKSSIFVYLDPVMLAHNQGKDALVCAGQSCLCRMTVETVGWSLELLRKPLAGLGAAAEPWLSVPGAFCGRSRSPLVPWNPTLHLGDEAIEDAKFLSSWAPGLACRLLCAVRLPAGSSAAPRRPHHPLGVAAACQGELAFHSVPERDTSM